METFVIVFSVICLVACLVGLIYAIRHVYKETKLGVNFKQTLFGPKKEHRILPFDILDLFDRLNKKK